MEIAGDEIAAMRRFVYVPEDWQRDTRAADTRNLVLRIVGLVFGGLLAGAAVTGVIAWSRGRYAPRLFVAVAGVMLAHHARGGHQRLAIDSGADAHGDSAPPSSSSEQSASGSSRSSLRRVLPASRSAPSRIA